MVYEVVPMAAMIKFTSVLAPPASVWTARFNGRKITLPISAVRPCACGSTWSAKAPLIHTEMHGKMGCENAK